MVLQKGELSISLRGGGGGDIKDKTKVHPPPGKPKGKNSSKIVSIKSNKPGMVKIRSLVKEKSGPSINIRGNYNLPS
jgi:hypothetical protein